jgi:endonuclease III
MLTKRLIDSLGGRFSRELGIDLSGARPDMLFKWLLASKLFGARISTDIAIRTYRELERRGVTTPEGIIETGWDGLVEILDDGGYVRYDFSTATRLLEIAGNLLMRYGGDLNELHKKARGEEDLERLLKDLGKGIGDVTVNIFLRELRDIWSKARPEPSELVKMAAGSLGLIRPGENALDALERIWEAHKVPGMDFSDIEAALLRLGKGYCKKSRCNLCPATMECKKKLRNQ